MNPRKVVIIAPFWRRPNHLSAVRVERFIRWLGDAGWQVVLVRAGGIDAVTAHPWGVEVAVRDPLGLHPETLSAAAAQGAKEYSPLVALTAALVFNPDPGILWARRAACHPLVLEHGRGADFVLSSSPPESAHLCAAALATRLGAGLLVDMRDGWLDEPLKPLLRSSRLQRWREGRLEMRVVEQARQIFVTSKGWQTLLEQRLPQAKGKVTVLTNCYPLPRGEESIPAGQSEVVELLHAGQFTGSKYNNRPGLLLAPLFAGVKQAAAACRVVLQGRLNSSDLEEISEWQQKFAAMGVDVLTREPEGRLDLFKRMATTSGLLLLSATHASILAKLFEYLPTKRPILAVTLRGSAIWEIATCVPQIFAVDMYDLEGSLPAVLAFLKACTEDNYEATVPAEFSEGHNATIFIDSLLEACREKGAACKSRPATM